MPMPKRRGHGEGSIYQRKDGRWCATVAVGRDAAGKLKRRYIYGDTRKEVQEQLTKLLADKQQGIPIDPVKQTVGEFLTQWLEDSAKGVIAPTTYAHYEKIIRLHIIPAIGSLQLGKLSPQHLQHFYSQIRETGRIHIARLCHAILHRSLGQAEKWGYIPRNVADLVDAPRVPRKEMQVLNPDEAVRFLEVAKEDRFYALYVLAITCGLRQGELLGLKWEDIDFDGGTLHVCRQLQWFRTERPGEPGKKVWTWHFKEPKSAKSRRTVVLPSIALAALKQHKAKQAAERLELGEVWQDYGLVFPTTVGTPVEPNNLLSRSFRPLLERAGLPKIRFHDLRHTAATLLLAQGTHPKLVQEQLGHSQISLTLDTYSHVLPALKREVAEKMDALFGSRVK